jgi:N-acyl-D-amino-acid deacylase
MIIKNAEIIDGTGKPGYKADISLGKTKISAIGKVESKNADPVIDASGLVVAPGFVDIHSHSDYYLLIDPRAESKIMQGVTTEVGGNCGYSAAPVSGNLLKEREKSYQKQFGIDHNWHDLEGYFEKLKKQGSAVNIAPLLGHNTIRGSILGYENRAPQKAEMGKMEKVVLEGFEQGAFGMSVGLIYPPSCFSTTAELIRIFKIVKKKDGLFTCHMRSEGEKLLEAIAETIQIGREAGVRTQISHLKTSGNKNWNKINKAFSLIESALTSGLDIACDRYPYTASNTGLNALLPDWVFEGGTKKQMDRLKGRKSSEIIKKEILKNHPEPEYWETVMISQVVTDKNRWPPWNREPSSPGIWKLPETFREICP